jgi:hypothetical protein
MTIDYPKIAAKSAARAALTGIWPAITTPFDASGKVGCGALESDMEYLAEPLTGEHLRSLAADLASAGLVR